MKMTEKQAVIQHSAEEFQSWNFSNPVQAAKHLPQFTDNTKPAEQRITKGDADVVRDAANEFVKQVNS